VLAVRRRRHVPALWHETGRMLRDEARPADPPAGRALFVVPVGPGELEPLRDTVASIRHFEPSAAIVVLADGATELRPRDLTGTTLLRAPRPSGGPPRLSPPLAWAYRWCLRRHRFDVLCKIDTDALLTGPGLIDRAVAAFADLDVGMLGSSAMREGGGPGDTSYGSWVLAHERRWSPRVRRAVAAAKANGWRGEEAHGGVYLLSRHALRAMDRSGHLVTDPPWWSLIGEDLWFSLGVYGAGLRIAPFGGPDGPTASAQGFLPLDKHDVLEQRILAVHSVRRGLNGESEPELRAFFRAERERTELSHA
jgi:hypothetical protein